MRLRTLISLLFAATSVATAQHSAIDALNALTTFRTVQEANTEQVGWLDSSTISVINNGQYIYSHPLGKEAIKNVASAIRSSKKVFLSAYFLGEREIIEALCHTKKVNNATVVCILENKVSAQRYITPDYLTQNGVLLFYPDKNVKLEGYTIILDDSAYILPSFNTKDCTGIIVAITDSRMREEIYLQYLSILNLSEMSDYTKMRNPNAMRIINDLIK